MPKRAQAESYLLAALEPFAKEATRFADLNLSDAAMVKMSLPVRLFRNAAAALDKAKGDGLWVAR